MPSKIGDADYVYVTYADLHGLARGKLFPADRYQSVAEFGMRNCCGVFSKDATGTPVLETGILWENGADDNVMRPCPETLRPAPWRDRCAMVVADAFEPDGAPLPVSPRHALKQTVARFRAATGAEPVVGYEIEFTLLAANRQPVSKGTQAYSIHQMTQAADVLDALATAFHKSGIAVDGIAAENSDGQYEVSLRHTDALVMADALFQAKHMIKEVACRAGYHASFMALPHNGLAPNSLHVNVSLKGGRNEFGIAPDGTLLPGLAGSIYGLLDRAGDLLPLFLPTINAFKAPYVGSFFPRSASWGFDNRSVLVRVPDRSGPGCRLEFRLPTADANPYLALAGTLALMLRGLEQRGTPSAPVIGNGFEQQGLPPLTFRFEPALERLAAQEWLGNLLGSLLIETFLTVKRRELSRFNAYVTDWEREIYGTFF